MSDVAEKWLAASNAARKSEHHFPADCLAEAVVTYRNVRAEADDLRATLEAASTTLAYIRHLIENASDEELSALTEQIDWHASRALSEHGSAS